MANQTLAMPYQYFPDPTKGRPVFFGSLYIGEPDKDPQLFPVQVWLVQENGPLIPLDQPLNTGAGGIVLVNGAPAIIVVDGDYSLRVRNQQGAEVYYISTSTYNAGGGEGGGGSGDFVARAGDSMFGDLAMWNETAIHLYSDQATTERIEIQTSSLSVEGERSGVRLFDQHGNNGSGAGDENEELVSIRTENGADDVLRSAVIAQRNLNTQSSTQDWHGLIGLNKVRADQDQAVFLLQGEAAPFMTWLGTKWDVADPAVGEGLNSSQLHICRPASGTTHDYIELCNAVDGDIFTVGPDGTVNIPTGAEYQINGVSIGGGLGEAPIDGNTYGRKDAAWVDIGSIIGGDFLARDGSNAFVGGVGPLQVQQSASQQFIETGAIHRIEIRTDYTAEPANKRATVRMFDVDGNDGYGIGNVANEELLSMRTQVNGGTGANEAALVLQNNVGTSTSANGFNALIGFSNLSKTTGYHQFFFDGLASDYPAGIDRRRAWFGSQWSSGPNPAGDGLESLQLYINRTSGASSSGFLDMRVEDVKMFNVTDEGRVDAAGVIRAQGNSLGFGTGFGLEMYADAGLEEGAIRVYDADTAEYKKLFIAGDEIEIKTTNNADNLVTNAKFWQNPLTPTEDEFALFSKAQFRQYSDASGANVAIELIGTATADNGLRVFQPTQGVYGIQLNAATGDGANSIWMRRQGSSSIQDITLDTGAGDGDSVIYVNGMVNAPNGTSIFKGISMEGTNNSINFNGTGTCFNLREPTSAQDAATKNYVDSATGGGGPYMDLATNQTANGEKTFNDTTTLDGAVFLNNGCNLAGNQLYNPANPTANTHVGDRLYNDGRYLAIGAKAADANLLDGINSTSFVQTSGTQSISGQKTWSGEQYHSTNIRVTNGSVVLSNGSVQLPFDASGGNTAQRRDWILSQISDIRLKDEVRPLQDATERLMGLDTFSFEYRNESDNKRPWKQRHLGLSAQQVQDIYPEAVHHLSTDRDDQGESVSGDWLLGLDYAELVPALIQALQEMNRRLENLEA